jgi:hypothetical protein
MMASDEVRINRSDIRAQLTGFFSNAEQRRQFLANISHGFSILAIILIFVYIIGHSCALRHVRLELRRQVWPSLVARNAVASRHAPSGPWLDLTAPNSVSDENCGVAIESCHEPDVPTPDAVPNAVPQYPAVTA